KTGHLGLTDQDSIDEAWDKLQAEMKGRPAYSATDTVKPLKAIRSQTPKWKILLRVAAILLIGFGLYSAYDYYGGLTSSASISDSIAIKTIKAEYGQQIKFTLQDGTTGFLNSGSKISYAENFGQKSRMIQLDGEAYFQVNNDRSPHPFLVKTNNAQVRDIGTEFNIQSYSSDSVTTIAVTDGVVEVSALDSSKSPRKGVVIRKGDKAEVSGAESAITVTQADLNYVKGWFEGKLIFKDEPLSKIALRLERSYNVEINIASKDLRNKKISGSFRNEKIENILSALAISVGA